MLTLYWGCKGELCLCLFWTPTALLHFWVSVSLPDPSANDASWSCGTCGFSTWNPLLPTGKYLQWYLSLPGGGRCIFFMLSTHGLERKECILRIFFAQKFEMLIQSGLRWVPTNHLRGLQSVVWGKSLFTSICNFFLSFLLSSAIPFC